jgi:hypothetical protein
VTTTPTYPLAPPPVADWMVAALPLRMRLNVHRVSYVGQPWMGGRGLKLVLYSLGERTVAMLAVGSCRCVDNEDDRACFGLIRRLFL